MIMRDPAVLVHLTLSYVVVNCLRSHFLRLGEKKKTFQADIDFDKSPASHPGGREEDAADGHLI